MGLSCECDFDPEPGSTIWQAWEPDDYRTLETKRSRRCCSCGDVIRTGATVRKIQRWKVPDCDIERAIYGDGDYDEGVPRAPVYQCERCADLAYSLLELGFCDEPWEDQRERVKDYAEIYGPAEPTEGES